MSLRFALVGLLLAVLILSPSRMTGQDPATKPRTDGQPRLSDQTYRVSVDLVNIFCSVWDRKRQAAGNPELQPGNEPAFDDRPAG